MSGKYINDNYRINFKNVTSEIYIGKGIIGVIENKLKEEKTNRIETLKIFTPYLKIETINKFKSLDKDSKIKIITNKGNEKNQNINKLKENDKDITLYEFKYNPITNDFKDEKIFLNLHAKIYLINDKYLFISSANLTKNGTTNNFETITFIKKEDSLKSNNNYLIYYVSKKFDEIATDKNIIKEKETLLSIVLNYFKKYNFSD